MQRKTSVELLLLYARQTIPIQQAVFNFGVRYGSPHSTRLFGTSPIRFYHRSPIAFEREDDMEGDQENAGAEEEVGELGEDEEYHPAHTHSPFFRALRGPVPGEEEEDPHDPAPEMKTERLLWTSAKIDGIRKEHFEREYSLWKRTTEYPILLKYKEFREAREKKWKEWRKKKRAAEARLKKTLDKHRPKTDYEHQLRREKNMTKRIHEEVVPLRLYPYSFEQFIFEMGIVRPPNRSYTEGMAAFPMSPEEMNERWQIVNRHHSERLKQLKSPDGFPYFTIPEYWDEDPLPGHAPLPRNIHHYLEQFTNPREPNYHPGFDEKTEIDWLKRGTAEEYDVYNDVRDKWVQKRIPKGEIKRRNEVLLRKARYGEENVTYLQEQLQKHGLWEISEEWKSRTEALAKEESIEQKTLEEAEGVLPTPLSETDEFKIEKEQRRIDEKLVRLAANVGPWQEPEEWGDETGVSSEPRLSTDGLLSGSRPRKPKESEEDLEGLGEEDKETLKMVEIINDEDHEDDFRFSHIERRGSDDMLADLMDSVKSGSSGPKDSLGEKVSAVFRSDPNTAAVPKFLGAKQRLEEEMQKAEEEDDAEEEEGQEEQNEREAEQAKRHAPPQWLEDREQAWKKWTEKFKKDEKGVYIIPEKLDYPRPHFYSPLEEYAIELITRKNKDPDVQMDRDLSQRPFRMRKVILKVKIDALGLPPLVKKRLIALAGRRVQKGDILKISCDKQFTRGENLAHAKALFSELLRESFMADPTFIPLSDLETPPEKLIAPHEPVQKNKYTLFHFGFKPFTSLQPETTQNVSKSIETLIAEAQKDSSARARITPFLKV